MRKLLTILFLIITFYGNTQTHKYYFDATSGNDSYTSVQAQNSATPWKTITKLNSFFTSLVAGDSVLFKCGETFYGQIVIRKSGSSGSPIVLASYGSGAKPIITGFSSVTSWTNIGTNLWESTSAVTTSSLMLNMVTVNGSFQAIGRYPKFTGSSSDWITTTSNTWAGLPWPIAGSVTGVLAGSTNYTGGQVVMRKKHWVIDKATITSQSYSSGSTTVNFLQQVAPGSATDYPPQNGYGFFFQNHVNACTQQGDWAFNTSTKKIEMYSVGAPTGVKIASIDTLIYSASHQYISFYGLNITGANWILLQLYGDCSYNTISNCDFSFGGYEGIYINGAATHVSISNSTLSYINSVGVSTQTGSANMTFQYNAVSNVGMTAGMGQGSDGDGFTVTAYGNNSLVKYNTLQNCGYNGILFSGTNTTIQNNFIQNTCQVKDDGSAIYTYDNGVPGSTGTGKKVLNNVIVGSGSSYVDYGTTGTPSADGIYLDGSASYVTITGNSVANCSSAGFHTNSGTYDTITNNTFYNGHLAGMNIVEYPENVPVGLKIIGNIFFARDSSLCAAFQRRSSTISTWGTFDSNYYCRPIFEPSGITTTGCSNIYNYNGCKSGAVIERFDILVGSGPDYSLNTWQAASGEDAHSKKSPKTVTDTSQILFYYNGGSTATVTSLSASYIDVYSNPYIGSVTLQPYTSVVLLFQSNVVPLNVIGTSGTINCNGDSTTLTLTAVGGTAPYTYSLDGITFHPSNTFTVAAGVQTYYTKDNTGLIASNSISVTEPLAIIANLAYGEAPTNVSVLAIGGTPTYQYKIDAGSYQSSNIFNSVAAGNHTITVKDANGCTTSPISFTVISGGSPLAISSLSVGTISCNGGTTSATITPTGGTSPYTYLWSNGQTTATATGLLGNTYSVTITDNIGSKKDTTFTISQPTQITIVQISDTTITTHGGTTMVYLNNVTGGTPGYTYSLDGVTYQVSDSFPDISAGNYIAYVKDANACVVSQSFTITQPPPSSPSWIQRFLNKLRKWFNG